MLPIPTGENLAQVTTQIQTAPTEQQQNADMATVATNFAQAQMANQATLNAMARVLYLPTLLDFLK